MQIPIIASLIPGVKKLKPVTLDDIQARYQQQSRAIQRELVNYENTYIVPHTELSPDGNPQTLYQTADPKLFPARTKIVDRLKDTEQNIAVLKNIQRQKELSEMGIGGDYSCLDEVTYSIVSDNASPIKTIQEKLDWLSGNDAEWAEEERRELTQLLEPTPVSLQDIKDSYKAQKQVARKSSSKEGLTAIDQNVVLLDKIQKQTQRLAKSSNPHDKAQLGVLLDMQEQISGNIGSKTPIETLQEESNWLQQNGSAWAKDKKRVYDQVLQASRIKEPCLKGTIANYKTQEEEVQGELRDYENEFLINSVGLSPDGTLETLYRTTSPEYFPMRKGIIQRLGDTKQSLNALTTLQDEAKDLANSDANWAQRQLGAYRSIIQGVSSGKISPEEIEQRKNELLDREHEDYYY